MILLNKHVENKCDKSRCTIPYIIKEQNGQIINYYEVNKELYLVEFLGKNCIVQNFVARIVELNHRDEIKTVIFVNKLLCLNEHLM